MSGLTKFSIAVRVAHLGKDLGALGLRTGVKASFHQGVSHIRTGDNRKDWKVVSSMKKDELNQLLINANVPKDLNGGLPNAAFCLNKEGGGNYPNWIYCTLIQMNVDKDKLLEWNLWFEYFE